MTVSEQNNFKEDFAPSFFLFHTAGTEIAAGHSAPALSASAASFTHERQFS
ncbi:MAG: hypothetical protein LBS97_03930 [Treponema sp.]|jgi:hypothetical protein|nr:hypothetical protein [Treponema sp.]